MRKMMWIFSVLLLCLMLTPIPALALSFPITGTPPVISRKAWGADESIIIKKKNNGTAEAAQTAETTGNDAEEKTAEEEENSEIARTVTHDENGNEYEWPLQYAKKIHFIVLHYTGLPNELPDDPVQEMRNVYRSHAVNRGWGDIGYHFLIDRKGRIYEGRKGGEGVIGGHALPVNKVSIGVSLMGNYDEEDLPPEMLAGTISLLTKLTKQYGINPLGQTEYKGRMYQNIHGHSDNDAKRDPGRYFDEKFPAVRQILASFAKKKKKSVPAKYNFKLAKRELVTLHPDQKNTFTIALKNDGVRRWHNGTFLENLAENGLPKVFAKLKTPASVKPGATGVFQAEIPKTLLPGMQVLKLGLVINKNLRPQKEIQLPLLTLAPEPPLRVALSFRGKPLLRSSSGMKLLRGKSTTVFEKNEEVRVSRLKSGKYRVKAGDKKITLASPPRFTALNRGILEIVNYEKRPAWNPALNDNLFRGTLEVREVDGALTVINELPLEDYLKGVAEISNGDPPEKIKTIIILARSYAAYYRDKARKFPGKPYDLDDNPDHTQKYVGYGLELRSPNIKAAVEKTRGKIVTYQGRQVITPYFNQSDGRTRSAEEVWGWKNAPYLQSVPDAFCGNGPLRGHGVGVSGCGATELAKQGKKAEEIIKYYYQSVTIE